MGTTTGPAKVHRVAAPGTEEALEDPLGCPCVCGDFLRLGLLPVCIISSKETEVPPRILGALYANSHDAEVIQSLRP